jgi:hypothetical protein
MFTHTHIERREMHRAFALSKSYLNSLGGKQSFLVIGFPQQQSSKILLNSIISLFLAFKIQVLNSIKKE